MYVNTTSDTVAIKDNGKTDILITRLSGDAVQITKLYGSNSTVVDRDCIEELRYALHCFLATGEFDRDS